MNEKDLKIIRYLAGAIFLALALSSFLYIYPFLFASASSAYTAYSSTSVIRDIVSAIGAVMMAVSMLLGMRQVFMVGAGFQAVSCLVKLLFSRIGTPAQEHCEHYFLRPFISWLRFYSTCNSGKEE